MPRMSDKDIAEVFPTDDPATWNQGTWPPIALKARWRELYNTAFGTCLQSLLGAVQELPGDSIGLRRAEAVRNATRLAFLAAHEALRVEVENRLT